MEQLQPDHGEPPKLTGRPFIYVILEELQKFTAHVGGCF